MIAVTGFIRFADRKKQIDIDWMRSYYHCSNYHQKDSVLYLLVKYAVYLKLVQSTHSIYS